MPRSGPASGAGRFQSVQGGWHLECTSRSTEIRRGGEAGHGGCKSATGPRRRSRSSGTGQSNVQGTRLSPNRSCCTSSMMQRSSVPLQHGPGRDHWGPGRPCLVPPSDSRVCDQPVHDGAHASWYRAQPVTAPPSGTPATSGRAKAQPSAWWPKRQILRTVPSCSVQ
jgi:hypothetical protein